MKNKSPNQKKILIIEDEEGVREAFRLILGDDYPLILCESAEMAQKIIDEHDDIGLIFLDIKMPVVSGLELLPIIKQKQPNVPIYIVTGYKSVEIANEAIKRGANGYIVKPIDSDLILKIVQSLYG